MFFKRAQFFNTLLPMKSFTMRILSFIFLIASGMVYARLPENKIIKHTYTYSTLSEYEKQLFDEFLNDEFAGKSSIQAVLTDDASLRTKTRTAQALLFRNNPGDIEKAQVILNWVLENQYQEPDSKVYGVWKTGVKNDRLDQNWREFIGCDLIIIYKKYAELLKPELLDRIKTGLIHAAKGAQIRDVGADYTNISIMSAFLMDFVGSEFDLPDLHIAGLKKAKDIYSLYKKNETFSEFNSPTYYGVTLIGLALWREMASSKELRLMGKDLENALWNEISTLYNPNLKNMPGPYFRAYGMDMTEYFSITGIWIALALEKPEIAPLAAFNGPKYGEMSNIVSIFNLGLSLPKTCLKRLKSNKKNLLINQNVYNTYKGDSLKRASIFLSKNWMMGGLWGNLRPWNQIKTGTIHWKTSEGIINWLMTLGDGKLNVRVNKNEMSLFATKKGIGHFEIFVYSNIKDIDSFQEQLWTLKDMELIIQTSLPKPKISIIKTEEINKKLAVSETYQEVFKIDFEVPLDHNLDKPLVVIIPCLKN
jgi:hypothetical protein